MIYGIKKSEVKEQIIGIYLRATLKYYWWPPRCTYQHVLVHCKLPVFLLIHRNVGKVTAVLSWVWTSEYDLTSLRSFWISVTTVTPDLFYIHLYKFNFLVASLMVIIIIIIFYSSVYLDHRWRSPHYTLSKQLDKTH